MSVRRNIKQVLDKLGLLQAARGIVNPVRARIANAAHIAREMAYRRPRSFGTTDAVTSAQPERAAALAGELARKGIVTLADYLVGERLGRAQAAFEAMVARIQAGRNGPEKISPPGYLPQTVYLEDETNPEARTICANNPFRHAPEFLNLSTDPLILEIVARYLRRPFYLQQSIASRYLPMPPKDFGSFQWHHDAWGRKVNVMFLFTDVGDKDQHMTFIEGSHLHYHDLDRCRNSRFEGHEVDRMFPGAKRVRCTGSAGTVFIFDSNGMHRGNRSTGRHRDTLITNFNAGRYVWEFEVPASFRNSLDEGQLAFLERSARIAWRSGA